MTDLERMGAVAREAVVRAARVTRAVQGELDRIRVVTKNDRSPVTVADYAAQAVVAHHLAASLDRVVLVGEESPDAPREDAALRELTRTAVARVWPEVTDEALLEAIGRGGAEPDPAGFWTLDPVDGTKGFLRNEQYAISLAFIRDGRPVVGALACPNLPLDASGPVQRGEGVLFSARAGQGASSGPLEDGAELAPLAPLGDAEPEGTVRMCESVESAHSNFEANRKLLDEAGLEATAVRLDSQAKYAVVARQQADVYLRLPRSAGYVEKIWDHAAGALVAEETGHRVTDFHGKALDFAHGRLLSANRGLMVAGPKTQARLLAAAEALRARGEL